MYRSMLQDVRGGVSSWRAPVSSLQVPARPAVWPLPHPVDSSPAPPQTPLQSSHACVVSLPDQPLL